MFRSLFVVTALGLSVGLYYLTDIPLLRRVIAVTGDSVRTSIYQPTIRIEGAGPATEARLIESIPEGRSVFWWLQHRGDVATKLLDNGLVQSARVANCSFWRLGCISIVIEERTARLIAFVGTQPWLVDSKGAFIAPATSKSSGNVKGVEQTLPYLRGVVSDIESPDVLTGRVQHAVRALDVIEAESGLAVEAIDIQINGELKVKFHSYEFISIFDADSEQLTVIRAEAKRLKRLLKDFKGRLDAISQIDLAFDHSAVVKLKEDIQ